MMASRRSVIAVLCPLLAFGLLIAVQGCGGGEQQSQTDAQQEQAQAPKEEAVTPAPEPAEEAVAEMPEHIAGYTCPMHPEAASLEPGRCGICGMDLVEAGLHYTCPKCEGVHSHEPGTCPHCETDLVLRPVPDAPMPKPIH